MATSRFMYLAGDRLSEAELTAACLDGDLVALGEGFVPADVVESPTLRAASLRAMLGDVLVATLTTAAWVHGGADDAPVRHTVQRGVPQRLHHVIERRLEYRDPFVPPADVVLLGGSRVTTRERTVADLARTSGDAFDRTLREWAARDASLAAAGLEWLDHHARVPNRRRASAKLKSLRTT